MSTSNKNPKTEDQDKELADRSDLMIPTFITDGDPVADLPDFVHTANVRSLYGWRPGESLDDAILRKKTQGH